MCLSYMTNLEKILKMMSRCLGDGKNHKKYSEIRNLINMVNLNKVSLVMVENKI